MNANSRRFAGILYVSLVAAGVSGCNDPPTPEERMGTAAAYEFAGKLPEAVIELKNVLQVQPNNAEARYKLGAIALRSGAPQVAEYHFRKALEEKYDPPRVLRGLAEALFAQAAFEKLLEATLSSDHGEIARQPEILALRGHAQLQLGRIDEAATSFDDALAAKPRDASALLGRARVAVVRGQLEPAAKHVAEALAADPRNVDAWLIKGDLAQFAGKIEDALASYESALAINPKGFAANLNLASLYMNSGKFEQARKSIAVLREVLPGGAIGDYMLALLEFRMGHYPAAREALKGVHKSAPNYVPAKALAGMIAFASGNPAESEKLLAESIERYPSNILLRKLYAAVLLRVGKTKAAMDILDVMAKTMPNDYGVLALMAEAKFQDNDTAVARKYFERASKLNPNNARVRLGLGLSRMAAGDTSRALADLEAAIDLGSTAADAFLVTTLVSAGQLDKAAQAVARIEKHRPNDALTYNLKGSVLAAQRNFDSARAAFEKAATLQPNKLASLLNLAQLEFQAGDRAAARARLTKALEKDDKSLVLLMALADLDVAENRLDDARQKLRQALAVDPNAVMPSLAMARLQLVQGDHAGVVESTGLVLRTAPENTEALNMQGFAQLQLGRVSEASSAYSALVNLTPNSAQAHYGLSGAQSAAGNQAAAEISLRRALTLKPDFPEALVSLAALQLRLGRFEETRKTLAILGQRYPKMTARLQIEGDLAKAQKRWDAALESYRQAFTSQRTTERLKPVYDALTALGRSSEAQALGDAWIKEHPNDRDARLFLADRAIRAGNLPYAAEQYRILIAKEPTKQTLLHNLRWVYERMNDPRALQIAEQAYRAAPQNPGALFDLGRLLIDTNAPRAIDLLEQARVLSPAFQPIRYHLARAYEKAGDNRRAREELQQVLRGRTEFPERREAEALLRRLQR